MYLERAHPAFLTTIVVLFLQYIAPNGTVGNLISITDSKTVEAVKSLEISGDYWTGGYLVRRKWRWNDGSNWGYENWSPNEPNKNGIEDKICVRGDGTFFDCEDSGRTRRPFICQYKVPDPDILTVNKTTTNSARTIEQGDKTQTAEWIDGLCYADNWHSLFDKNCRVLPNALK